MNTLKHLSAQTAALVASLVFAVSANAGLLTFDMSVTNTGYRVTGTESAGDLLTAHALGSAVCTESVDGFVRMGPRQTCGVFRRNYSMLLHTEFQLGDGGNYRFQTGADWGRGGGIILTDRSSGDMTVMDLTSEDIWWGRRWSNRDVFITELDLDPGAYALSWIGFENCCAGETTVRYSYNGSAFKNFTKDNFASHVAAVPEPGTITLLGLGLAGFAVLRKRRSSFQAMRAQQKAVSDAKRGVEQLKAAA
ncbi:MAG: CCXG family PEP-CTERM protein [Pseudomonadota bacterium]